MIIKYGSKQKYRYQHQLLSWILISIAIISIAWSAHKVRTWIHNSYCGPISYIIFTGKRHYTTDIDINQLIVKLRVLNAFITQDVNVIQKQIESLSWIQQVSVRKQWPDTLKIHIVEYIPLACWNNFQIISTTGIIFKVPKEYRNDDKKTMPSLYGPEGSEKNVLANYYVFNEILKSVKFQVKSLHMDTRYSWQLILQDGIHLKLGRNNMIERLYYFIKIYPILIHKMNDNKKYIDYIDLRYRSGFSVRWG